MARLRTQYVCRSCGGVQAQWMGKCPACGGWDSLERFVEPKPIAAAGAGTGANEALLAALGENDRAPAVATPLTRIERSEAARLPSGLSELDRVLGGGFVAGSVVLLGGEPGIGKSTLLLQAAGLMARSGRTVLYASSEESALQSRLRAERLFGEELEALDRVLVLADTNLARIAEQAGRTRPALVVIDSIQMVYSEAIDAPPGSITQLRRCCTDLVFLAKRTGAAVVLVGHVTKDGQLAGPKLLEHLVDAVLAFEGDCHHALRAVRAVKNRFGTTLEVGLFEMTGVGLREADPSAGWLDSGRRPGPGAVVCPVVHGTRAALIEIQALTATGLPGNAKRKVSGLDPSRLAMLIAVLEKHGGLRLHDQDIFASTVGGLRVVEPASDLAVVLAIAGAHRRQGLPEGFAAAGEVGLGGEVRPVHQLEQRIREAGRLRCRRLITACGQVPHGDGACTLEPVRTVSAALEMLG